MFLCRDCLCRAFGDAEDISGTCRGNRGSGRLCLSVRHAYGAGRCGGDIFVCFVHLSLVPHLRAAVQRAGDRVSDRGNPPHRAGCTNVINLHGTIYRNVCPKCGAVYPMEYIKEAKGVPLCEKCLAPVRPKICLFGEAVDNGVITRAANEMGKADVVLVLGAPVHVPMCQQLLQYYEGNQVILVKETEHFSDTRANICIHSRCDDFLENLVRECEG